MSEFSKTSDERIRKLTLYLQGLINGDNGTSLIKKYDIVTDNFIPADILKTFDNIFDYEKDIEKIKVASNKLFNILYKAFNEYSSIQILGNSFLYYLVQDNLQIKSLLNKIRPLIQNINKSEILFSDLLEIKKFFIELSKVDNHYTLKENILFPVLEKKWKFHDCLKLMWSFHDDIRKNIKKTIAIIDSGNFNLQKFNKISTKVYFNINTIIFREEKVLYPVILQTIDEADLLKMLKESVDIGYAFIDTSQFNVKKDLKTIDKSGIISFDTGKISVKEAELIFNHLPVDLTFVDANNKVKYFSTPKHRIFPRTKAIIGRKVQDCHPPESVAIVDKIINAFKRGKRDKAAFWIKMGKSFVLIQYFAVCDKKGEFIGTLEVSQEISELQNLKGERRLLDWID